MKNVGDSKGFTFVELMVVVSIIGILAAIATPVFGIYKERAYRCSAMLLFIELRQQVENHYGCHGEFPQNNFALGLPSPEKLSGLYIKEAAIENGAIHFTFGHRVTKEMNGQVLSFRPVVSAVDPSLILYWCSGMSCPSSSEKNAKQEKEKLTYQVVHGINRTTQDN